MESRQIRNVAKKWWVARSVLWGFVRGPHRTRRGRTYHFFAILLIITLCILHLTPALASPRKGFYEGPYLTLSGGVMQLDWDTNQRTNVEEGKSYEPLIALGFGWNIYDWFAPELSLRYTTDPNDGRREHIAGGNIGCVFTWLANPLLELGKWHILPFVKPGVAFQIAVLPGDSLSTDERITTKGVGPSIGGGIRFTFKDYLYLGFQVQEELLYHEGQSQTLNPGGPALIYQGGWKDQFEVFTMVGIHY
ncbi:MAG: hypothetical protein A3F82_09820 [Deltaproteobacteria bacterium RIFCSPLOWO2_12_FULL_44_12]|nr:MAG: hypothetical protein A2712_04920 [Deltaproteobacteria bacterium RIFCSPHIGHO2_01_FULL_43_49]OGQ15911.1 MAG: hypothetical protein A3D22_07575 [Deltaproteobacteria bacterium RIFCSPHIGHO2_02_FULL_44_53]OGQ28874.1 MAG: hypothetical protein A3D98_05950 [Deltaproteobacteria bacterium RIFCSPHIGHO2_12_FULL_44_21]OGQ43472.1 MAG: hypothetical protein A3I70_00125 [Deltaproteobacteria bacterium RIFCSPLOWO2_02_FULL_44_34]OGQ70509.1 MAG: hypothetical protein A3F82_09820 [Deltaproteobacteria bacterium 